MLELSGIKFSEKAMLVILDVIVIEEAQQRLGFAGDYIERLAEFSLSDLVGKSEISKCRGIWMAIGSSYLKIDDWNGNSIIFKFSELKSAFNKYFAEKEASNDT